MTQITDRWYTETQMTK